MAPEDLAALIKYRLLRAKETLDDAKYAMDGNRLNMAVNRLYYACFYSNLALLSTKGLHTKSHDGAKTMLSLHFVNTGILSREFASTYGKLFNTRITGDYDIFPEFTMEDVEILYVKASAFITEVEKLTNVN